MTPLIVPSPCTLVTTLCQRIGFLIFLYALPPNTDGCCSLDAAACSSITALVSEQGPQEAEDAACLLRVLLIAKQGMVLLS